MAGQSVIGNLAVNLTLETAAFEGQAKIAEKRMEAFGKKLEGIGTRMRQVGTIMTAALTVPLAAFATKAFSVANDAAELQSKFDQTFGAMSAEMNKWAEATGNAMGRSTREIQEGAAAFGIYFNQAAKTRQEAARLSQQFTVLAQDLASFHNTDVTDAVAALRSGLSGESEPMRRFGVFINEASVKAKALELGLQGVNGKLTDQEKIMARSAIILEQTKNAQGDVARNSESTANQLRRAAAAFEELQIIVGTKLLPVVTPLIEKLASALDWFTRLPVPVQNTALAIVAVSAALGPVLVAFGAIIPLLTQLGPLFLALKAAALASTPVIVGLGRAVLALVVAGGPITLAIAAVGALYLAFKNWDKIKAFVQDMVTGVSNALRGLIAGPLQAVSDKVAAVTNAFRNMWDRVVGHSYVPDMVAGIALHFAKLDDVMVRPALLAAAKVTEAFREMAVEIDLQTPLGQRLPDTPSQWSELSSLADSLPQMGEIVDKTKEWRDVLSEIGGRLADLTGDWLSRFVEGSAKLKDLWKSLLAFGIQTLTSPNSPLVGLLSGKRANGGPVVAGGAYLVGERGPELFFPGVSGRVISNDDSRAMMGGGVTMYVNTPDADSFRRSEGQITRQLNRRLARS